MSLFLLETYNNGKGEELKVKALDDFSEDLINYGFTKGKNTMCHEILHYFRSNEKYSKAVHSMILNALADITLKDWTKEQNNYKDEIRHQLLDELYDLWNDEGYEAILKMLNDTIGKERAEKYENKQ